MSRREDTLHLHHMLDYARQAVKFNHEKNRSDLETDNVLALATIQCLVIIGEAVNSISEELRQQHPEIPWSLISGTRNRLVHGYVDFDLDIIWAIVDRDLPQLISQLESILEKEYGPR
jgi:uncharacterized protein with HEPN domain